jgi:hypothetical protein
MEKQFNLEDMLWQWKQSCCQISHGKISGAAYYKVPPDTRFELLQILVGRIKDAGKPKEYFIPSSHKDTIIKACIPPEHCLDKQKYARVYSAVQNHLYMAIAEVYAENPKVTVEKKVEIFDPTTVKSSEPSVNEERHPEMAALLGYDDE